MIYLIFGAKRNMNNLTGARPQPSLLSSNIGASSLVAENSNTSLFIIISNCFTVRVSNQLAFRVRKAAT